MEDLIALKDFTDSVGLIREGSEFKALPRYAQSLVDAGFAQLKKSEIRPPAQWDGCTVVIVGSGVSLTIEDLETVHAWRDEKPVERKVIVINLTFRDALWADAMYAADDNFWDVFHEEINNDFLGQKWSQSNPAHRKYGVRFIQCERRAGLGKIPGVVHSGGNSGYQAIGLAYHLGVKKIVLLGFDMERVGDRFHYHGGYPKNKGFSLSSPIHRWKGEFGALYMDLLRAGVEAVNASRFTAIKNFPRALLGEALKDTTPRLDIPVLAYSLLRDSLHYRRQVFAAGLQSIGCRLRDGEPRNFNKDVLLLIWNRYGANHDLARRVEDGGGTVVVAENGYIAEGGGTPKYDGGTYALALSGHNGIGTWRSGGAERWNALGIQLKPWRENGEHVLVCPNRTFGTPGYIMPEDWWQKTVTELRKYTKRPIVVRPHPGSEGAKIPLSEDLKNAWAVVIWSSSVGVHSLVAGVPVFQCSPKWICHDAASHDLSEIEMPRMEGRETALQNMAWAQWNYKEILSGDAFRHLLGVAQ